MVDFPIANGAADDDLSAASSRLDASLLRYVLLFRSRMNMLVLDREVRSLVGERGLLLLPPGITRSNLGFRVEATMQFAVELALARPEVVRWVGDNALLRQMAIDAAYYQADRWARGLPPVYRLQACGSVEPDMDRHDFDAYLRRCSRLDEGSTEPVMPDRRPSPSVDEAASDDEANLRLTLNDADVVLRGIVRGIALRLSTEMDLGAWRSESNACADHSGFRPPPPELFDALLLGRRSLITTRMDDESPQWEFAISGERHHGLRELHEANLPEGRTQGAQIEEVERVLEVALATGSGTPAFALLADGLSLLPTTPAWADVQRALRMLRVQRATTVKEANPREHEGDEELRTVADFHRLLGVHIGTVVRALCAAAFLSELAELATRGRFATPLRSALRVLAEGLRFAETETLQIDAKLALLWQQWALASRTGTDRPADSPFPATRPLLDDLASELPRQLQAARDAARATDEADMGLEFKLDDRASEDMRQRLARWCSTGRVGDASLPELYNALRSRGPARWLTLDPRRMTLPQWSHAAIAALTRQDAPAWMAVIALQRLGADTLSAAEQQQLLEHLVLLEFPRSDGPLHAAGAASAAATAIRDGAWHRGGQALGTVLLLSANSSTLAERWTRPPSRGLVLLVTVGDLQQLLSQDTGLLRALPVPVVVRVEGRFDKAVIPRGMIAAVHAAGSKKHWRLRAAWHTLTRNNAFNEQTAMTVDPVGPDDLFDSSGVS